MLDTKYTISDAKQAMLARIVWLSHQNISDGCCEDAATAYGILSAIEYEMTHPDEFSSFELPDIGDIDN